MFTRITAYCDTKLLSTHLPHKYAKPPLDQVAYLSGRLLYSSVEKIFESNFVVPSKCFSKRGEVAGHLV